VKLLLDWKPEPEFGGFYAAQKDGAFDRNGLDVDLKSAGEGAPTWQLVAGGKTEFATTAADQVLIARDNGADVVAVFAVYQTSPQGVMAHKARGFRSLRDVWTGDGTLAAENNAWLQYLRTTWGNPRVKLVGYSGGVGAFLSKPDYSQQCFVTSEPLVAAKQGGDPQTFLVAESGYNPYTTVVICRGEFAKSNPEAVRSMVSACREGWRSYLDNPKPANELMGSLNRDMDAQSFAEAATAQKPLIEPPDAGKDFVVGSMTARRWDELAEQMSQLKTDGGKPLLSKKIPSAECFILIP
jgi:NitT/TauT family transport system substrate-binding protein